MKDCQCKQPLHLSLLKTSKDVMFYTGMKSYSLFNKLYNAISPYVRRRCHGAKFTSSKITRKFKNIPKRMGPERKLPGKDEFY